MSEFIRSGVKVRNFFNVEKTSLSSQILTQIQRNGILRNQIWTQMKITIWIIWFSIQGAKTGKDNGFSVLFDIESFDYGYYDEGSEGLKVILFLTMNHCFDIKDIFCFSFAFAYSIMPLSQICFPGCNCSPPGHADNETAGFPHCSWHREPDPHHPHLVHGQPSGQNLFASSLVLNHNMKRCSNCPFSKTEFSLKLCLFLAFCPIKNSLLMICKLQLRLALIHNIFSFLLM